MTSFVKIKNSPCEAIHLETLEWDGHKCYALRPYIFDSQSGEYIMSNRGFVLDRKQLLELQKAIESILEGGE